MSQLRPIAIYLPQFHPVAENDLWWGKGFTEWTNVAKANPLFKSHYQPHLPADLGFYDLRLPETREAQAALAKEYGIYGFCYYHYWFNGRRILERPFDEVLKSGKPDFPFMLCWANENWTRRWDGMDQEILLKQDYDYKDDQAHMQYLCKAFADPRYIRVDGKPVFVVYKPHLFPNIRKTTDIWREEAQRQGIGEIYLAFMQTSGGTKTPAEMGFDAAVEFQPDWGNLPTPLKDNLLDQLLHKANVKPSFKTTHQIYNYAELVDKMMHKIYPPYTQYRGVTPSWDNHARRKIGATVIQGSSPEIFGKWLQHIIHTFTPPTPEENFIFINAWNEWAEGNHLEPCQKWGRGYLESLKKVLENA